MMEFYSIKTDQYNEASLETPCAIHSNVYNFHHWAICNGYKGFNGDTRPQHYWCNLPNNWVFA